MNITIPKEIRAAVAILEGAGFDAYLVGGCVRDILIGRAPQDWDITTNAKPEKIQELFPKSFYENKFGTVSVVTESDDPRLLTIEITPFRLEGKYSDKRHPDEIKFAKKLEDDLARRDFTVNAMAMKLAPSSKSPGKKSDFPGKSDFKEGDFFPGANLIDPFSGQKDFDAKLIRAVGDPYSRFEEDALRIK